MNARAEILEPDVVALGYYDGATEGFARSVKDHGRCYFKLIAWDADRDRRLFVINEIDESTFSELVQILIRNQQSSSASIWIPNWQFNNETDERDANNIVEMCKKRLALSNILALGEGINDDEIKIFRIDDQILPKVHSLIDGNEPDKLENWIARLN